MARLSPKVVRVLRLFMSFMLGSGLASLVTFVAMPVYTRLLAPEQFGYFDLASTYGTIVSALVYADVWVGVMRLSLRDRDPDSWLGPGLGIFAVSTALLGVATLVIGIVFDPDHLWWVFLAMALKAAATFWGFAARGAGFVNLYAVTGAINAVLTFVASVVALYFCSMGTAGLFLGIVVGSLVQVVMIEARVGPLRRAVAARAPLWSTELLRFTLPLGINSVAFWVFTSAGRVAVASEMGLGDNGVFAAAAKLGGLVTVVSGVVTLVWQQISFEGGAKTAAFYGRGTALAALLYGAGGALAVPLGTWFYLVTVDERYQTAWVTVPGFILVAVLAGYSNFVGNIFYALQRTTDLFISTVLCLVVVVVATVPLVREVGINGANLALIAGYAVNIGSRHLILQRRVNMAISIVNVLLAATGVTLVGIATILVGLLPASGMAAVFVAMFGVWTLRRRGPREELEAS